MSKALHESSSGSSVLEGADAADEWLQLKGVEFELIEQAQATGKCRDSAAERGISLRQIVKSMVFLRVDGGGHVQCCVPGHLQVDQAKLQAVVGATCRLVEEEELFRVTGKKVGCVHPFVNGVVRRYIDKRVGKEGGLVSFNTGDMSRGLILSMEGLLTALGDQACIQDVACSEDGEEVDDLALEMKIARHDARFILETSSAVPYYAIYSQHVPRQAPDCVPGSDDASHHIYWLRLLARHAATAGHALSRVPPEWLAQLASAGGATKFAREAALKAYISSGEEQEIPKAAATGDAALASLRISVDEVLLAQGDAVRALGGDERKKEKLSSYLMGLLMKQTMGVVPPQQVREALMEGLSAHIDATGAAS